MTYFLFKGRLNQELRSGDTGDFVGEIKKPEGGKWFYKSTGLDLKVGDEIHYLVIVRFIQQGRFNYKTLDGQKYTIRSEESIIFLILNGGSCFRL